MAVENEVVTRFTVDLEDYKAKLNQLKGSNADLSQSVVVSNTKMQASIKTTGDTIQKTSQSTKAFSEQMERAAKAEADFYRNLNAVLKSTNDSGKSLIQLNKELSLVKQGLENASKGSKNFEDLAKRSGQLNEAIANTKKEIVDLGKTADKTLQQQFKEALLAVQRGEEGATEKAAALRDQIASTNASVAALASGSKLDQFSNVLGNLKGQLAGLDFASAAGSVKQFGSILSSISFKEILGGIKSFGSSLISLASQLVTSPVFLIGGAIAGITYGIYSWLSAESDLEKQIRESKAAEESRFLVSQKSYDRQIELAKSLGESTRELEREKTLDVIKNAQERIRINALEAEAQFQNIPLLSKLNSKQREEVLKNNAEYQKQKLETAKLEQELLDARNKLESQDNQRRRDNEKAITDAIIEGTKKQGDALKKADDDYKKAADKKKADFDKRQAELDKAIDDETKFRRNQLLSQAFDYTKSLDERKAALDTALEEELITYTEYTKQIDKINDEEAQKQAERQAQTDKELDDERAQRKKNLDNILKDQTKSYEDKRAALEDALENEEITYTQYVDYIEAEEQRKRQAYIESARVGLNAFVSLFDSLALLDGQNSEFAKVGAIFRIAIDTAEALANTIKGATAAAAATGPAAPFVLGGYIAAGIAEVFGAFAQVTALVNKPVPKAQPSQVKRFAQGTPYVTGGTPGQDSVPALLMPGERVTDTATNIKYWEALEDIRTGKFADNYIHVSDMAPMLGAAISDSREMEQETSAINIANSLIGTGKWKGENIQRSLKALDKNESRRNEKLVEAIKENKSINLRKR